MRIRACVGAVVLLYPIASVVGSGTAPGPQAASQKVSPQTKRITAAVARPTEGPQILEFTAAPNPILAGERCGLRWKVGPGTGGSPIESLQIKTGTPTAPGGLVYGRLLLEGSYPVGPVAARGTGLASYTLTVTDRAGRSANRTVEIRSESLESFISGLSDLTFDLRTEVDPGHRNHIATIGFESGSPATAQGLMICLYQAYSPIMSDFDIPDGPLAGIYDATSVVPGHNEFRIGLALRSVSPGNDDRRALSKIVLIIAKEYSPGVLDRILIKALYDLIETSDGRGPLYSVRLIKVW